MKMDGLTWWKVCENHMCTSGAFKHLQCVRLYWPFLIDEIYNTIRDTCRLLITFSPALFIHIISIFYTIFIECQKSVKFLKWSRRKKSWKELGQVLGVVYSTWKKKLNLFTTPRRLLDTQDSNFHFSSKICSIKAWISFVEYWCCWY